jgi:hypothetical protein
MELCLFISSLSSGRDSSNVTRKPVSNQLIICMPYAKEGNLGKPPQLFGKLRSSGLLRAIGGSGRSLLTVRKPMSTGFGGVV